jgi:hypothetical protein
MLGGDAGISEESDVTMFIGIGGDSQAEVS